MSEFPPDAPDCGDVADEAVEAQPRDVDYLLLSDVHLGSDLVQHMRPWASEQWLQAAARVDGPLTELLDHYRTRPSERAIELVLAGDFLDLVGVAIGPSGEPLDTPLTREEEVHGLGSAADHVVRKMEAIELRHRAVFEALARFVDAGHSIALVRGNHDIELHWQSARLAFVQAVARHLPEARRAEARRRVRVYPWFYLVPGTLYVEHGHEFDATCSYGDPLVSSCPRDPRRIRATAFSVLLRQVARPTPGVNSASHGYEGMGTYVQLLRGLGLRGSAAISRRYGRASLRLLREGLPALRPNRSHARRREAALTRFVQSSGLAAERLHSLRELYTRPAVESIPKVARLLYLDRIGAAAGSACLGVAAAVASGPLAASLGVAAAGLGAYAAVGSGANQSPHESLAAGARAIAELFDARFIVMGHTHAPVMQPVSDRACYVNLGSWGQDDPPDEPGHPTSQTYLWLEKEAGAHRASFLRWSDGYGPLPAPVSANGEAEELDVAGALPSPATGA